MISAACELEDRGSSTTASKFFCSIVARVCSTLETTVHSQPALPSKIRMLSGQWFLPDDQYSLPLATGTHMNSSPIRALASSATILESCIVLKVRRPPVVCEIQQSLLGTEDRELTCHSLAPSWCLFYAIAGIGEAVTSVDRMPYFSHWQLGQTPWGLVHDGCAGPYDCPASKSIR